MLYLFLSSIIIYIEEQNWASYTSLNDIQYTKKC